MNRIKEIRALTGLSQAAFCEKYHIPRRTLEDWERSLKQPPEYVIELLEFKVKSDYQ